MLELNKIYNMDCIEGMKMLDSESIDLVVTSPPYNIGGTHHTGNNRFNGYNSFSDDLPEDEYQEWQINVLQECYRVLKKTGSLWYNHKNRITKGLQITPYEWLLKTPFIIKQEIVWFNGSQNFDKIRFYPMTERVYWLAKSPDTKMFNAINHHDLFTKDEWQPAGTKGDFKRAFPQRMIMDIMSCFPDAGIVLDPFMGSGTTALASIDLDRNFIGFEIDPTYFELANGRILDSKAQIQFDFV